MRLHLDKWLQFSPLFVPWNANVRYISVNTTDKRHNWSNLDGYRGRICFQSNKKTTPENWPFVFDATNYRMSFDAFNCSDMLIIFCSWMMIKRTECPSGVTLSELSVRWTIGLSHYFWMLSLNTIIASYIHALVRFQSHNRQLTVKSTSTI